jgi:uncharacterized protein (DUF305 family)
MTSRQSATMTALVFTALGSAACAGHTVATAQTPASAAPVERTRADSARYSYTEADVHFMSGMIGHHAQAIVMAGMAPTHGASPSIRILAERIINAQRDEIAKLQLWLRDRGQPVPSTDMTMHAEHAMLMPGMLTAEQLQQLERASGEEFDRLFLSFMIQHHQGAVTMVEALFGSQGAALDDTVFKLASDVHVDQITEIERMRKMLAAVIFERP